MKEGVITLIFKRKGSPHDIRQYRPITLLTCDLKLFTSILARRIAKVTHQICDPQNTAIPGRQISGSTMALHVMQQMPTSEGREGYAIFLDWEKCFDLISWVYINHAMAALGFGPFVLKWVRTLYQLDQPLARMVLVNGAFSPLFFVTRGTPQGDSVSSIMQVVVFEGVSRIIRANSHIGITIPSHREGEEDHTLSHLQYADDTTGMCCTLAAVMTFLTIIIMVGKAMTSRLNQHKTVGLVLGTCPPMHELLACGIMWAGLTHDAPHMLIALGAPFSQQLELDSYWRKLYKNMKERLCKWANLLVAQSGRLLVCKAMLVSMATYNLRNLLMPKWFEKALKRDLAAFVWQRQPQIDIEEEGTSSKFRRWLSSSLASLPANLGGIAELDLTLFSQAMLVGWVKRFIHPRMAPWKLVVEHWLSPLLSLYTNGDLRWLMVSTVPIKHIISATPCPLWRHIFGLWVR